jgi:ABC transporter with metal-binding/Fe-S-binding domain ATP-binding protein
MRLAAMISGGKDSICALTCAMREHEVGQLVNVRPVEDSLMYHVPCASLTSLISEATGIPLVWGISASLDDELALLRSILQDLQADGIVAGTIDSNYQMSRLRRLCDQLDLELYAPLWNHGGERLLRTMARSMDIAVVQVAAYGMDESWLGRRLDDTAADDLCALQRKYGVHLLGEGGEYETLVLDAPIFDKRIRLIDYEKKWFDEQCRGHIEIHQLELQKK